MQTISRNIANFLSRVRQEIQIRMFDPKEQLKYQIGKIRQQKVIAVLSQLEREKVINGYIVTEEPGFADVIRGIDFCISYVGEAQYHLCSFSVTGEKWIQGDKKRHPDVPAIAIGMNENENSIRNKILALMEGKK